MIFPDGSGSAHALPPNGERENMPNNKHKPFHKKRFTPDPSYVPPYDSAILALGIDFLKLGDEVAQKLTGAGISTVMDVVVREEKDFYRIYSFDKKNLGELKSALNNRRLRLKPPAEKASEQRSDKEKSDKPVREDMQKTFPKGKEGQNRFNRDQREKNFKEQREQGDRPNNREQKRDFREDRNRDFRDKNRNVEQKNNKLKKNSAIWNADGISEKRTKEEREAKRPKRPRTEHPSDKYIKINKNNKWGFATRDGREVIKPEYDDVFTFKDELCCVESEDAFGFIDREGKVVIPLIYECASSFSEGYACVFKGGVCGYIDKEGITVVPFAYDAGTAVENGECRVKKAGKWGELHIDDPDNVRWIN